MPHSMDLCNAILITCESCYRIKGGASLDSGHVSVLDMVVHMTWNSRCVSTLDIARIYIRSLSAQPNRARKRGDDGFDTNARGDGTKRFK